MGTLNLLKARVLDPKAGRIEIDGQAVGVTGGLSSYASGDVCTVALRPEAVTLGKEAGEKNRLAGTIEEVAFLGAVVRVRVRLAEAAVSLDMFNNPGVPPPERGQPASVLFARDDLLVLADGPA